MERVNPFDSTYADTKILDIAQRFWISESFKQEQETFERYVGIILKSLNNNNNNKIQTSIISFKVLISKIGNFIFIPLGWIDIQLKKWNDFWIVIPKDIWVVNDNLGSHMYISKSIDYTPITVTEGDIKNTFIHRIIPEWIFPLIENELDLIISIDTLHWGFVEARELLTK